MSSNSNHSDFELFSNLGKGDSEEALAAIMHKYKMHLLYYIGRFVQNEELMKEVFMDTMQLLWTQRKDLQKKKDPVAWMFRIAHNKALNKNRDEKRNASIPLENIPLPVPGSGNGAEMLEAKELEALLHRATRQLSPQESLIFRLSKIDGLERKVVASICKVSENTVRNQLSSSIRKIRKILSDLLTGIIL